MQNLLGLARENRRIAKWKLRERKRDALELEKKSSYATANEDYKNNQSIFGTGI